MAFDFLCPHCGASSRAEEFMIGESGPCHECGEVVTVFPTSSHVEPPQVLLASLFGALVNGALFFGLLFFLRTLPVLETLRGAMMLTPKNVFSELGATALAGFVGALLGAVYFAFAALIVDTRRAYHVIRRGLLIGGAVGLGLGLLIGLGIVARKPPGTFATFYERGEIIGTAAICGLAAVEAIGGLLGAPFAFFGEKRLVSQAKFTAPNLADDPAGPIEAKLVEEPDDQWRESLSSDRRQALIRRLGVVHQADESPDETDSASEPESASPDEAPE